MLETYFDLKIEEIPDCDRKWHQDVAFYRVVDKTGSVLGRFYMDPYIRDDKGYAGADKGWYVQFSEVRKSPFLICNRYLELSLLQWYTYQARLSDGLW